jgi:hypothetical protein
MKAPRSLEMTPPFVVVGCLTMPVSVSGETSSATVEYDYLRSQVIPTPATPRPSVTTPARGFSIDWTTKDGSE